MNQKNESAQIAREALSLSLSNYLCRVLYLIRGVGVAALLQPEVYGIWSVLKNLQDSTAFANLGASFALLREVALGRSSDDVAGIQAAQQAALNLALLVTAMLAAVLFALSFTGLMPVLGEPLRISLVVMLLASITYYIPRQLQAQREFYFQAKYLLLYAFFNTALSLIAVYFWGLKEMLWALVIAHLLAVLYVMRHGHIDLRWQLDPAIARRLVSAGLPVMLGGSLFFFLRAADQFLIFGLLGSTAAGYYAISNFVAMTITQVPIALAATLFPRMMERHSDGASRQEIEHLFFEPMKLLCIGIPILLGGTYFAIEPVLVFGLPEYLPALSVIRIALIGMFFQTVWSLSHSLLLTFDKQQQQMKLALGLLVVSVFAVWLVAERGGDVDDVTWVAAAISFLSATVILLYISKLLRREWKPILASFWQILWPGLFTAAACLAIDHYVAFSLDTAWSALFVSATKLAAYLLSALPLCYYLYRYWRARQ